jgi:hypothetical protein
MRQITVEDFERSVRETLREAPGEDLLIVEDGCPVGLLHLLDRDDTQNFFWEDDPDIWAAIERGRKGPFIPLEDFISELIAEDADFERLLDEASRMTPEELDASLTLDEEPGPPRSEGA